MDRLAFCRMKAPILAVASSGAPGPRRPGRRPTPASASPGRRLQLLGLVDRPGSARPQCSRRTVGHGPHPRHPAAARAGEDVEVDFGATFDVVEARDGWFRIENARRWSQAGQGASTLPSGWVSGRFVGFQLQTDKAFAEPDPASPVVVTSWDEDGGLSQFGYRNPTACRGEWVRLTVVGRDGRERQGWVRGVCALQETTCDGVQGDLITQRDWPGY